jgi:hypothetical protein
MPLFINPRLLCPTAYNLYLWGGRIRTLTYGARVRCPTIRRLPISPRSIIDEAGQVKRFLSCA